MTDVTQASLCIAVGSAQPRTQRGQSAGWTVVAWTTGGDVADATLQLQATPADGGAPGFSFGCGRDDGTSTCDLGTVDAASAPRQLQVQLTVPVTASAVTSVSLAVTGTAPDLVRAANAAAAVSITTPNATATPTPTAAASTGQPPTGQPPTSQPATPPSAPAAASSPALPYTVPATMSPLPVGNLPGIAPPSPSATMSPGGNAASLFPTLAPSPAASGSANARARASTRAVANSSALPEGASIAGAQIAGLSALALAFVLAVTRLSIRRRPATPPDDQPKTLDEQAETLAYEPGEPGSQQDQPEATPDPEPAPGADPPEKPEQPEQE